MSKKKLAGIIATCAVAIIVAILLIHFELWVGTPAIETYILTAHVNPLGTGSVCPSGGEYEFGEQVTLSACPASGYTFDHWSGHASGNSTTITITMNQDYSVIADFAPTVLDFPMLVAPECGAVYVATKKVGFAWTPVDGADEYYFVLSANPDLSVPTNEVTLTRMSTPGYTYTGTLDHDTVYYWQVRALSGGSVISQSPIGVFRTIDWSHL